MIGSCLLGALAAASPAPSPSPSTVPAIRLAPGRPDAAPLPLSATDAPRFVPVILPVPWVALALGGTYENFAIGPTRHEARLVGGYYWSQNLYFDPNRTAPVPLGPFVPGNVWVVRANWGWRMAPWATLYLESLGIAGGPEGGTYEDALTGGASGSAGPVLQLSSLDDRAFPTTGWLLRVGGAYGRHVGQSTFDFQRAGMDLQRYVPLGPDGTLAFRLVGQAATPQLAWLDRFSAGGGQFLRGYAWNRFTGDRVASGTVEYRHLLERDLLARVGLATTLLPLRVGVAPLGFVNVGRAWEARAGLGLPVGSDMRWGCGAGVMALINEIPVGRVEVGVSPEGFYPVAAAGASF